MALGPISWLWERLSGWQQDQVEAAAKEELKSLSSLLEWPAQAPSLLAARLKARLDETGGEALITSPFGWLTHCGLVRRPSCSDVRCDDGVRLDTGARCDNCRNVLHNRRAGRARITAEVDEQLPGLDQDERDREIEARMRRHAEAEAADFVARRGAAQEREAQRAAARAKAETRAAAEAAARQVLPCTDCGRAQVAGLCEVCGYRRRTEAAIVEAGLVAATWTADLTDPADVAATAADVRAHLNTVIEAATQQFLGLMTPGELEADPAAAASALAFTALQVVEQALPEYRSSALGRLGRTDEAEAEARRAYTTEQGRRWYRHNPTGAHAVAAATREAEAARTRTAEYLLTVRLEQLRQQVPPYPKAALTARG
ncbi:MULTISPECIES: hypothetical protein [unclassified Streptomyces]|uniref:hypothetical protein n=1 Tax=unclassified Streptomyces TaxID=2593676 RepID=UPI001652F304|nr:hypothetical protein [Streptomyces sp. sk2.1]